MRRWKNGVPLITKTAGEDCHERSSIAGFGGRVAAAGGMLAVNNRRQIARVDRATAYRPTPEHVAGRIKADREKDKPRVLARMTLRRPASAHLSAAGDGSWREVFTE